MIKEVLVKLVEKQMGSLEIKPNIKPGHGPCCTCQECGYHHDECNCGAREWIEEIDKAVEQINKVTEKKVQEQIKKDAEICFEQGKEWDSAAQITNKNYANYSGNLIELQLKDGK